MKRIDLEVASAIQYLCRKPALLSIAFAVSNQDM